MDKIKSQRLKRCLKTYLTRWWGVHFWESDFPLPYDIKTNLLSGTTKDIDEYVDSLSPKEVDEVLHKIDIYQLDKRLKI